MSFAPTGPKRSTRCLSLPTRPSRTPNWTTLIDRPVAAYSEANYGPVVYYKGPLFFHDLRQELGDEAFFALLQNYFATFRYQISSQADLREAIDQAAGRDMSPLYQQWLGE